MGIVRPSVSPTWHAMETDSKAKAHRKRQSGPKAEKKKKKKSTEEGSNPKAFTNKWVLAHSQQQELPSWWTLHTFIYALTLLNTCISYNSLYTVRPRFKVPNTFCKSMTVCTQNIIIMVLYLYGQKCCIFRVSPLKELHASHAHRSAVRAARAVRRNLDNESKRTHVPIVDRTPLEPPPMCVAIVGPPRVGKTLLLQCLLKNYTRQNLTSLRGPITVVSGTWCYK